MTHPNPITRGAASPESIFVNNDGKVDDLSKWIGLHPGMYKALCQALDLVPPELKHREHWVTYRIEKRRPEDTEPTKVPYNARTLGKAKANDSSTWSSYGKAIDCAATPSNSMHGVGREFGENDPYCGIDFDDCLKDGELLPWAEPLVSRLQEAGAYGEISPSGTGIKFWVRGRLSGNGGNKKGFGEDGTGGLEIYDRGRFFTVTGNCFCGGCTPPNPDKTPTYPGIPDCQGIVDEIYALVKARPGREPGDDDDLGEEEADQKGASPFTVIWGDEVSIEERVKRYLDEVEPSVSGQNGSGKTFGAACRFGPGFDLPIATAKQYFKQYYNQRCDPPWSDAEIDHKFEDAYRKATSFGDLLNKPRKSKPNGQVTTKNGHPVRVTPEVDYSKLSEADLGIVPAESVVMEPINWAWKYRMASGEMTLLAGEGGKGKSQVALAIAANITCGGEWWDKSGTASVGTVIIVSAEDSRSTTLKPRLIAAGADLSKIIFLTAKTTIKREGKPPLINFEDLQNLAYWQAVTDKTPDCKMIIFDPLPSYLGRGVNDSKNNELRAVLEPFLDNIIRPKGISMLAITHLNKSVDLSTPVHRVTGSIAYANLPRNVHFVATDPEKKERAFFAHAKCNISPQGIPALAFEIKQKMLQGPKGEAIEASYAVFEPETVSVELKDIISGEKGKRGPKPNNKFAEWLLEQLQAGEQMIFDLVSRARAKGFMADVTEANPKPSIVPLYNAKDRIEILHPEFKGRIGESTVTGGWGSKPRKAWVLLPASNQDQPQEPWDMTFGI